MTAQQRQIATIIAGAVFLALLACTWFSGYHKGRKSVKCPVIEKTDTIWHTDTYYVEKPIEIIKWKDREKLVYVPVNKDSLVYVHDTTYSALPREFRQYSGENYTAQVSGIDPVLDWLRIQQKTAYITNTVKVPAYPKFVLSPMVEVYGLPGIFGFGGGISASYWFNRWQFTGEVKYGKQFMGGNNSQGIYGLGKVSYNLIRR